MKIVVFNVKFSENLGDGILAQCLEKALCRDGGIEVDTIDLAGRVHFGATSPHRRSAVRVLHVLPSFARRLAVTQALRSKLRELGDEWDRKISAADAVVLGGGNLFQDDDLNFPLKIGTLLDRICRQTARNLWRRRQRGLVAARVSTVSAGRRDQTRLPVGPG